MLRSPYAGIAIAVLAVAACLAVECWTVSLFLKARAIASWPTTTGVILSSELASQFQGTSTSYEAKIEYEYRVGEQHYKSNQVRTRGASNKHQSDIEPLLQKFAAGKEVPVYYNPAQPAEAYLEAGVDFVNYIIIISPLFFASLGVYYIVEKWKEIKAAGRPGKEPEVDLWSTK